MSNDRTAAVIVVLPPALLSLFPGSQSPLEITASDVSGILDALDQRWPGMRDRIRDSRPAIRRHMKVFVDGAPARLETPVTPGAEVYILTAISGGA